MTLTASKVIVTNMTPSTLLVGQLKMPEHTANLKYLKIVPTKKQSILEVCSAPLHVYKINNAKMTYKGSISWATDNISFLKATDSTVDVRIFAQQTR